MYYDIRAITRLWNWRGCWIPLPDVVLAFYRYALRNVTEMLGVTSPTVIPN